MNALFVFDGAFKIKKKQSFNLTIGTEAITQLLKSNFEWFIRKRRHQYHAFAKKGKFLLNMH